jgi:hypothetical protein
MIYFDLLSMRLSRFQDFDRGFSMLTQLTQVFFVFFIDIFSIVSGNVELIMN